VVVADREAAGDVLPERAEATAHALADRLEGLFACRAAWMPTQSAEQ
jgi:hypothetical protein